MRLLYLHPGGLGLVEYSLFDELRKLGHEICVLEEVRGTGHRDGLVTPFYRQAGDGVRTYWHDPKGGFKKLLVWPIDRFFKRAFNGRNLAHRMWAIHDAVRVLNPDMLISPEGFAYAIPASFLKQLGLLKPALLASYIGGDILDCPEAQVGKRRTPLTSWLIRRSLKGIDILRPASPMLRDILLKEGADAGKIIVSPTQVIADSAVLADVYSRKAEVREAIRKKWNIPLDAPLIVTLSNNYVGKGLHVLAAAWPKILAALPECRWLLCGPNTPWLEQSVWPLLKQQRVEHTVYATGRLSGANVFEHLAAADLHVNPTLCEGLNLVTVEAASVGTPTVTTDHAGVSFWVARYNIGKVVPVNHAGELTEAVVQFFGTPGLSDEWQRQCREMAANFSRERIAKELSDAIKSTSAARQELNKGA